MDEMTKKCTECGGTMYLSKVDSTFVINEKELTLKGIEAYVCQKCGEYVYTTKEARMIENVIKSISESYKNDIMVLNLEETAEFLRISNQTVYNMIKDGRIKAYKVGREWRFLQSDLIAYMNSSINDDCLAARGGKVSEHDMKIIMEEMQKRKK